MGPDRVYFVHSYKGTPQPENEDWVLATCQYGGEFISAVKKGNVHATQFHPEKSGVVGLDKLRSFLEPRFAEQAVMPSESSSFNGGYCSQ